MTTMLRTKCPFLAFLAVPATVFASLSVSNVNVAEIDGRAFKIDYTLTGGDAVVTVEMATNGVALSAGVLRAPTGDVNRLVSGDAEDSVERTIFWRPWAGASDDHISQGNVTFTVRAWPTNDPPPYMVVSLAKTSNARVRYYGREEDVPGGVIDNEMYRKDVILLRKLPLKGVSWWLGSSNEVWGADNIISEARHLVTLPDNCYLGVFPVTQKQFANVAGTTTHAFFNGSAEVSEMRPMEYISFYEIRESAISAYSAGSTAGSKNTAYQYPNGPCPDSFLGKLRSLTGVAFDLPSEAQWEFACRAGHGSGLYGDGSEFSDENLARIACFGRSTSSDSSADPSSAGTPVVGERLPNDFGFYDMNGCVWEYCLDWWAKDVSSNDGSINANGEYLVTDPEKKGVYRVRRGGAYNKARGACRPSFRYDSDGTSTRAGNMGLRVACPAVAY